ncbi:MAG: DUF448 domain-containing protein [Patescibacteria group bacterium]|nr:DUF448 domain-containing protein [Patescibacteria group bacterium]
MAITPERTCAICRAKKPQSELFRFLVKNGEVIFDKEQKELGRGFYICSKKCWEEGVRKKRKIKIASRENKFVSLPDKSFEDIVKD